MSCVGGVGSVVVCDLHAMDGQFIPECVLASPGRAEPELK